MSDDLVKQFIAELQDLVRCRCHESFKVRGLHDPDCQCDTAEAVKVVADRIEELVKERDEARTAWEIEAATVDRFAERHERHLVMGAESRARIEELEAKLRHYKKEVVETAEANEADANARAEELEAQLAKAVETLKRYGGVMPVAFAPIQDGGYKARTTLAELTGGKDDCQ